MVTDWTLEGSPRLKAMIEADAVAAGVTGPAKLDDDLVEVARNLSNVIARYAKRKLTELLSDRTYARALVFVEVMREPDQDGRPRVGAFATAAIPDIEVAVECAREHGFREDTYKLAVLVSTYFDAVTTLISLMTVIWLNPAVDAEVREYARRCLIALRSNLEKLLSRVDSLPPELM